MMLDISTSPVQIGVGLGGFVLAALITLLLKTTLLSRIINAYLNFRYQYKSVDGTRSLTGPDYIWQDSQLREKFMQAREKSSEWEEKYGPIYRVWAGPIPEVIITTAKDIQTFYTESHDHNKSWAGNGGWLITQMLGSGPGLINGPLWRNLRKTTDPLFSHRVAMSIIPDHLHESKEFVDEIQQFELPRSIEKEKEKNEDFFIVNAVQALQRYPFFETARLFFGKLTAEEEAELWRLSAMYLKAFMHVLDGGINRWQFPKYLRTKSWLDTEAYVKGFDVWCMGVINRTMPTNPELPANKLWIAAQKGEITEEIVIHTFAESLFANLDITTHVLASSTLLLADNAEVQNKVIEEFGREEGDLDAYLAKKDTLLHYCLLEALRLQPVLAFTFPESAPRDKVLGGFLIPKNTTVLVDTYSLNIRNPFWGKDIREYRPERFATISPSALRYNMATFGFGPRKCIGQHISDKMLKSFLYHLFSQYEVSLRPNQVLDGAFKWDKTSWVGLFDVQLGLQKRRA